MIRLIFELVALFLLVWFVLNFICGRKERLNQKKKRAEQKKLFLTKKLSSLLEIADTLKKELQFTENSKNPLYFGLNEVIRKLKENMDLLQLNDEDCWYISNNEQDIEQLEKELIRLQQEIAKITL